MAFARKKQYDLLIKSEKGKEIIERLPEMKKEDFKTAFDEYVKSENIEDNFEEEEGEENGNSIEN